jgi:molybdate transport system regulatory protein
MSRQFFIKNRLWIVSNNHTFLGEGRVELLQAIDQLGSIAKAAKSMEMSYLKAWKLVQSMNESSKKPLVIRITGGKGGGGTSLTEHGYKAIKLYHEIRQKNAEVAQKFKKQLLEF